MPVIKNKVVCITGATSGIGAACAIACAKNGAKLLSRNNHGDTAYYEAYKNSNYEIEKYLELWPVIKIQRKYKTKLQKKYGRLELLQKTNENKDFADCVKM